MGVGSITMSGPMFVLLMPPHRSVRSVELDRAPNERSRAIRFGSTHNARGETDQPLLRGRALPQRDFRMTAAPKQRYIA
jgi:hypothetical protein